MRFTLWNLTYFINYVTSIFAIRPVKILLFYYLCDRKICNFPSENFALVIYPTGIAFLYKYSKKKMNLQIQKTVVFVLWISVLLWGWLRGGDPGRREESCPAEMGSSEIRGRRPRIVLFGDSITEQSFRPGGWGAALADAYSRKVLPSSSSSSSFPWVPCFSRFLLLCSLSKYHSRLSRIPFRWTESSPGSRLR